MARATDYESQKMRDERLKKEGLIVSRKILDTFYPLSEEERSAYAQKFIEKTAQKMLDCNQPSVERVQYIFLMYQSGTAAEKNAIEAVLTAFCGENMSGMLDTVSLQERMERV